MKPELGKNPPDKNMCRPHGNFLPCTACDEAEKDKKTENAEEEKENKRAKRKGRYDANILPPTEKQIAFAEALGFDREGVAKASRTEVSRILSIKSEREKEKERHQIIEEKGFAPGVKVRKLSDGSEYTISTVKTDGWLCFKGVRGGASPKEYEVIE